MVLRALAPYQVAFPAGCQHCRTWRPAGQRVSRCLTQPPCAVLLCCVDGHGWLGGDDGKRSKDGKRMEWKRWSSMCRASRSRLSAWMRSTDERGGAGESLRQNPARAGVDPVLLPHPSFGVVCFLSFFFWTGGRTTRVGRPRGGMKVAARIGEGLRREIERGRRPRVRVGDG